MLVMEMSRKEQQIPAIRFNGFTDAWEQRKLGEYIEDYIEKTVTLNQYPVLTSSQQQGIVLQEEYFADRQVTTQDNIGYFVLPRGYFTYRSRSDNGIFKFNRNDSIDKGIISYFYPVFKIINGDSDFFLYLLNSTTKKQVMLEAEGTGQKVLSLKKFKNITISVTSINEQLQIGAFLKQLERTIALHQRQVNNYKLLKNSLIQQMFPQGGEQLPKMRFAGFSGEWVRKKLGEFVEINRGLTYKPEDVVSDGIRVLRSSNIKQDIFELRADDVFVRHDAANIPEIKNGDILVTSANGSTALVGKHAIVDKLPSKTVHGGFMLVIRCEHNYFINTWMSSSEYKRVLQLVQGGNGAIGNLSKKVLEEAVIAIPSDEEQTKIGNFFKKLDDNITFHQQKTDDYQQLKKVLLQQMFL